VNSNNASNAENNAAAKRKEARATRKAVNLGNWNNKRNMNNVKREIQQARTIQATSKALLYKIYQEKPFIMDQYKTRIEDIQAKNRRTHMIGDYYKYIKYYTKNIDMSSTQGVRGQGSYGKVFVSRAFDGSLAIVKLIYLRNRGVRENAISEAGILQEITPLDISPEFYLFFIDPDKNCAVLIMKYLEEAIPLNYLLEKTLLESKEYLTLKEKADTITNQLTDVVNKLHEAGIVHYDLKPENALAQPLPDGSYKIYLIDFGSAQRIKDQFKRVPETPNFSLIQRIQFDWDVHVKKKLEDIKDANGEDWLYLRDHYDDMVTDGKWKVSPLANNYSLKRIRKRTNNVSRAVANVYTKKKKPYAPVSNSSSTY
jgi:serine/threonine protein kinase